MEPITFIQKEIPVEYNSQLRFFLTDSNASDYTSILLYGEEESSNSIVLHSFNAKKILDTIVGAYCDNMEPYLKAHIKLVEDTLKDRYKTVSRTDVVTYYKNRISELNSKIDQYDASIDYQNLMDDYKSAYIFNGLLDLIRSTLQDNLLLVNEYFNILEVEEGFDYNIYNWSESVLRKMISSDDYRASKVPKILLQKAEIRYLEYCIGKLTGANDAYLEVPQLTSSSIDKISNVSSFPKMNANNRLSDESQNYKYSDTPSGDNNPVHLKGFKTGYSNEQISNLYDYMSDGFIDTTKDNFTNLLTGEECEVIKWTKKNRKGNPNQQVLFAFIDAILKSTKKTGLSHFGVEISSFHRNNTHKRHFRKFICQLKDSSK